MDPSPGSFGVEDLLLSPRSGAEARLYRFGQLRASNPVDTRIVTLSVRRGDPSSFASLAAALGPIRQLSIRTGHSAALIEVSTQIERLRATERALASHRTLDDAALASRGVLAALRRVTRESAEIAIVIDRLARILARVLVRPQFHCVEVPFADEIDRPSLKVFVRACLIAEPANAPVWEWCFSAAPDEPGDPAASPDLDVAVRDVRAGMLRTIIAVLKLTPRPAPAGPPIVQRYNTCYFPRIGVGVACNWLTTQNYDAALKWGKEALAATRNVDALRVVGMATTNTGRHDLSIQAFRQAYDASKRPTRRAHLCAMQGLIIAKRKFNLALSNSWYEQGLAELAGASFEYDDEGDPAIEKAWIFNGLALNELLAARVLRRPIDTAFGRTFDRLVRAFDLVKEGGAPDYVYLRYNLLGNMSAFMSLQGEHRVAQELFERAFDPSLTEGLADALEWRAVLTTRRAGLYASAGKAEAALKLYYDAVGMLVESDRPVCAETIRRSVGILALRLGRLGEAEAAFREGLTEARRARSMVGAKIHGAGLINSLICQSRLTAATDVLQELGETEDLWLSNGAPDTAALSVAPPERLFGLSTSIPEIDLEYIEPVNISGVLSGGESIPSSIGAAH